MKWFILLLGIISNASASVLIKVAMSANDHPVRLSDPLSIITNLPLMSGLGLYGMALVFYAITLTYLPLNIAHPILTSGSIALVGVASAFWFGESLSMLNIIGILFIMLGVTALTMN